MVGLIDKGLTIKYQLFYVLCAVDFIRRFMQKYSAKFG